MKRERSAAFVTMATVAVAALVATFFAALIAAVWWVFTNEWTLVPSTSSFLTRAYVVATFLVVMWAYSSTLRGGG